MRTKSKDDVYKERSKERLTKIASSKVKTTMIGAIASIEKHLGHLWGHEELTHSEAEDELKRVFENLRAEILDKGNSQIRNLETEISEYDVEWKRYHIDIPMQRTGG